MAQTEKCIWIEERIARRICRSDVAKWTDEEWDEAFKAAERGDSLFEGWHSFFHPDTIMEEEIESVEVR